MLRPIRLLKLLRFMRLMAAQDGLLPQHVYTRAGRGGRLAYAFLTFGLPRYKAETGAEAEAKAGAAGATISADGTAQEKTTGGDEKTAAMARGKILSEQLQALGPSYIKLGQSLASRPDIIGQKCASDLQHLQDQLPPFAKHEAERILKEEFGSDKDSLFATFGEPVAAASIAQIHTARLHDGTKVAVKLLRPGIEAELAAELDCFFLAARMLERHVSATRRIKPVAAVQTLADIVRLETDLRLEAAALSEMGENTADDPHFSVPEVVWPLTSRHVLSMHWVDGIKISDIDALRAAGHDLPALAQHLLQAFLTHVLRDGFFHGDMHQGNLLISDDGRINAIDLGIMGRLDKKSRRFLAEILYGFITRNYRRIAEVHFAAGYVKDNQNMEAFAQALRSIGEPISGHDVSHISMARLLLQLFEVTEQFDMETQPQLLLLQKTMVVTEGVARSLDPKLNIWTTAEPIVSAWLKSEIGAEAMLKDAVEGARQAAQSLSRLPDTLARAERNQRALETLLATGRIQVQNATGKWFWPVALILAALMLLLLFGYL